MPRILAPFREGVVQVGRVDNKNTALSNTLSDPSCVNVEHGVLDTPRLTCSATDQDGLMEQIIEKLDESVQVDEELIRW